MLLYNSLGGTFEQLYSITLSKNFVCFSVSYCERRWPATDEPSKVWHDRGHGHVDSPERSFGPLQPEEEIQHVDDLCQCFLHFCVVCHEYYILLLILLCLRPIQVSSVWLSIPTNGCRSTLLMWSPPIKAGVMQTCHPISTPLPTMPILTCWKVSNPDNYLTPIQPHLSC